MTTSPPLTFSGNPLQRASSERAAPEWLEQQYKSPHAEFIPFFKGDPLMIDGTPGFLQMGALGEFASDAILIFLGNDEKDKPLFALDASTSADHQNSAPFHDLGKYTNLREIAGTLTSKTIAIIGQARWMLDWHIRNPFCGQCGAPSAMKDGGVKRVCTQCDTEHFPRTEPVAIILVEHDDACLLGRGPHFPPGFLSCLAGFVEAAETPEECAIREVKEEAGVTIDNVRYQFSQPWPFPSSLMMGFFATAKSRDLKLQVQEIEEAQWIERTQIIDIMKGDKSLGVFLPPKFTIARQLLERWVQPSP